MKLNIMARSAAVLGAAVVLGAAMLLDGGAGVAAAGQRSALQGSAAELPPDRPTAPVAAAPPAGLATPVPAAGPSRADAPAGTTAAVSFAAVAPPAFFVAVSDRYSARQGVAVYATKTGRLVRYLTPQQPGGGPSDPLLDAAGKTVVYAAGAGSCASDIYRVAVDGRTPPRLLVPGSRGPVLQPALAPTGAQIAYVQGHCDTTATELVVRGLTVSGSAVVLYRAVDGEGIHTARWNSDRWLSFLTTGGPHPGLHSMAATPGSRSYSSAAPNGCFWSSAAWFVEGSRNQLLASLQCGAGSRWLVLDRHLATVRTLRAFPDQRGAQAISVDATGTWAIYQENGASVAGPIWRWRFASSSQPQRITQGPYSPSWS